MLHFETITVSVGDKRIVSVAGLSVRPGEIVALMGANGSGKSSLAMALLGDSRFTIQDSSCVTLGGVNLLEMTVSERAQCGLYVTWQNPIAIPGVSVFQLAKAALEARGIKIPSLVALREQLKSLARRVGLPDTIVERSVHDEMSGGEHKRLELLLLLLLKPKVAILDEIDSGLDVDGLSMVGEVIAELSAAGTACVVITHYSRLLAHIPVSQVWVLAHGELVLQGGSEIAAEIERLGFAQFVKSGAEPHATT